MKNQKLVILTVMMFAIATATTVFAQDKKMDMKPMPAMDMGMEKMHKSPHHKMMMAYHHNATGFTQALWDMSSGEAIEDLTLARSAFGELKRSLDRMEEIHQTHMAGMGKMDTAMMEKMKPMMDKMKADRAILKAHVMMLDKSLTATTPDVREVEIHTAVILMRLKKMEM